MKAEEKNISDRKYELKDAEMDDLNVAGGGIGHGLDDVLDGLVKKGIKEAKKWFKK